MRYHRFRLTHTCTDLRLQEILKQHFLFKEETSDKLFCVEEMNNKRKRWQFHSSSEKTEGSYQFQDFQAKVTQCFQICRQWERWVEAVLSPGPLPVIFLGQSLIKADLHNLFPLNHSTRSGRRWRRAGGRIREGDKCVKKWDCQNRAEGWNPWWSLPSQWCWDKVRGRPNQPCISKTISD